MSLLCFVLVALLADLLASAAARPGAPQYIQGQWVITEENSQYGDTDGQFLTLNDDLWPETTPEAVELVTSEDQSWQTTLEPYPMTEQDTVHGKESSVWKIILIVAILLVSVVGTLSLAYYMCVWRGGRIHYQPQKLDYV